MEQLLKEIDSVICDTKHEIDIFRGKKMVLYAYIVGVAKRQLLMKYLLSLSIIKSFTA